MRSATAGISVVLIGVVGILLGASSVLRPGAWYTSHALQQDRAGASASLLSDGRVLVTGGSGPNGALATVEICGSDGFVPAKPLFLARARHTSTTLKDGRVLVTGGIAGGIVGGAATNHAEIYDPAADSWSIVPPMAEPRAGHVAMLLQDGRVLISGGEASATTRSKLEIFDPAAGAFRIIPGSVSSRKDHAAARLGDGRVLIAGGSDGSSVLASTDIFDPVSETISPGPVLSAARKGLSATTLIDGRVLFAGGNDGINDLNSAEIYDSGNIYPAPGHLTIPRSGHLSFLLPHNNTVLIVSKGSAELFLPWTNMFAPTGSPAFARSAPAGTPLLADGALMVTGGGAAWTDVYHFPTIRTDQSDYAPGDVVTMTGSGWEPGEVVTLELREVPHTHAPQILYAAADARGNFVQNEWSPELHDIGVTFYLLASGRTSQAMTRFTDAGPSSMFLARASGAYGSTTTLAAILTSGSTPLANKSISFSLNGSSVGTALTNAKGVATLTNISLVGLNAGTYSSIIAATFAGDSLYQGRVAVAPLIVNRIPASVTPNAASKVIGDPDPIPLTTGTLAGFLSRDGVTAVYTRTPGESFGTYSISATLSPAAVLSNYDITYRTADFTITKYTFNVCVTNSCNGAMLTITPTAVYEGSATATVTLSPATVGGKDALNSPGVDASNRPLPRLLRVWIAPANDAAHPVFFGEGTATKTGPDASGKYAWSASITAPLDPSLYAGNYTAYVYGDDGAAITNNAVLNDAGYVRADTTDFDYRTPTASLTITQATATVSVTAANATYTGSPYSGPVTCSATGPRGEAISTTVTYEGTSTSYGPIVTPPTNAGTYNAICSAGGINTNYIFTFQRTLFTISPKAASVTPASATKVYGSTDPVLTGTLTGFASSDAVRASYSRTAGETVTGGPYIITATLSPAAVLGNYTITYNTANFTITPKVASVVPAASGKNFGSPDPILTGTLNGFLASDNVTVSFGRTPGENMSGNPYTISGTLGPASVLTNYAITYGVANFTIIPRADTNVYTPADYTTSQPPAAGQSYGDSVFGSNIKRLTDSTHTLDAAFGDGRMVNTIGTEYSTMTPFNRDNTRLLLEYLSYFALHDGSGNFLANLPFEINSSSEPRWSRKDPNILYYRLGNQLKQYNVATTARSVVHTFSEYSAISGLFESDICFDGNHFVLVGDGRFVFVYEISTDTKGPVFDAGGIAFDSVYITPDDNVLITWDTNGTGRSQGVELFNRNMVFQRQVARAAGHMDVTRDTNGDEVLVWFNAGDLTPICNNGLVKIRLADATQTCLLTFDWSLAGHVSATDNSGWVFVETYAPGDPIPPSGWFRYTDELLQIKLDGTQVRRLAHHHSRPFNSYVYQPKASVSRDGRKLVYSSNFGLQSTLGYPTQYSDAYLIDVSIESPGTAGTAR